MMQKLAIKVNLEYILRLKINNVFIYLNNNINKDVLIIQLITKLHYRIKIKIVDN